MFTPMHHDAACLSKIGIFSVQEREEEDGAAASAHIND